MFRPHSNCSLVGSEKDMCQFLFRLKQIFHLMLKLVPPPIFAQAIFLWRATENPLPSNPRSGQVRARASEPLAWKLSVSFQMNRGCRHSNRASIGVVPAQ